MITALIGCIIGIAIGYILALPTRELDSDCPHILPPHESLPVIPHVNEF